MKNLARRLIRLPIKVIRKILPIFSPTMYGYFEYLIKEVQDLGYTKKEIKSNFIPSNKKNMLMIAGGLEVGGVASLIHSICKNNKKYNCILVVDSKISEEAARFYQFDHIYNLGNGIKNSSKIEFVAKLISHYKIKNIIINNSLFGYKNLSTLRSKNVNIFDIIHVVIKNNPFLYFSKKYDNLLCKHIVISDTVKKNYCNKLRISPDRVVTINNAVDFEGKFKPKKERQKKYPFSIAFFGRLENDKNPLKFLDIALSLLEQEDSIHFFIVGGGSLEYKMRKMIKIEKKSKYFTFCGFDQNPERIIETSNMVLITSRHEGLPFAALESISLGIPVISARLGHLDKIIVNGVNGFIVASSIDSHVNKIREIISGDLQFERLKVRNSLPSKYRRSFMINEYENLLDSSP